MLGTAEILVILCIVLLLFGGKKLPELARSLGNGIREFKGACQGAMDEAPSTTHPQENSQRDENETPK